MSAVTSSIRFPTYSHSSLGNIISSTVPIRACPYLITGYTPFTSDTVEKAKISRKTTVYDVLRRLLQPSTIMASLSLSRQSCFISAFSLLRGQVDPSEVLILNVRLSNRLDSQELNTNPRGETNEFCPLGTFRIPGHCFSAKFIIIKCFRPYNRQSYSYGIGIRFFKIQNLFVR